MQYPSLRDYQNAIVNQNNFHIPLFHLDMMFLMSSDMFSYDYLTFIIKGRAK